MVGTPFIAGSTITATATNEFKTSVHRGRGGWGRVWIILCGWKGGGGAGGWDRTHTIIAFIDFIIQVLFFYKTQAMTIKHYLHIHTHKESTIINIIIMTVKRHSKHAFMLLNVYNIVHPKQEVYQHRYY